MDDTFYQKLLSRCNVPGGEILTYDEVMLWPPGLREALERDGKIRQTDNSEDILCNQCPERCPITPLVRRKPETDELVGTYVCHENPNIGRFEVDMERAKRWEIVHKKTQSLKKISRKKNSRNKIKAETPIKTWDKGKACFVHKQGKIEFYYKSEYKQIPLRPGSQAHLILCGFIEGTQTGKEIKEKTGSKSEPSQIVKNINRTINQHLRKIGHKEIQDIAFIQYSEAHSTYDLNPKIVEKDQIDRLLTPKI